MKKLLTTILATAWLSTAATFAAGEGWVTDMEAAKAEAAKSKKDLLLDFTGSDWCGWCIKLNKEVFEHAPFKDYAKDNFVLVELDFPRKAAIDPATKEQNAKLAKEMGIRGYPTIMLCDASGKPFAKTGYQAGGPEKYVAHLTQLRAIREKRDAAMTAAAGAEGIDKAKHLVEALKSMDSALVDACYSDVIDQIATLDPQDTLSYVKERKEAAAKAKAIEESRAKVSNFMRGTVQPLMAKDDFDGADQALAAFLKENNDIPEDTVVSLKMSVGLSRHMKNLDTDKAKAFINQLAAQYPESRFAQNKDKIAEDIAKRIEMMKSRPATPPKDPAAPTSGQPAPAEKK